MVELLVRAGRLTYHKMNKVPRLRDPKQFGLCIGLIASECALAELAARIGTVQMPDECLFLRALLHAEYDRVGSMLRARPQFRLKPKYRAAWAVLELMHNCVANESHANSSTFVQCPMVRVTGRLTSTAKKTSQLLQFVISDVGKETGHRVAELAGKISAIEEHELARMVKNHFCILERNNHGHTAIAFLSPTAP